MTFQIFHTFQLNMATKFKHTLFKNIERYANIIDTLFDQKSPIHREAGFPDVDRLQTVLRTNRNAAMRVS